MSKLSAREVQDLYELYKIDFDMFSYNMYWSDASIYSCWIHCISSRSCQQKYISLCVFKTGDKRTLSLVMFKIHNKTSFQKFARLVEAAPGDITAGEPEDESKWSQMVAKMSVAHQPDNSQRHINTTLFPNLMYEPLVLLSATMMMKICTSD